jgi:hypothetical protein
MQKAHLIEALYLVNEGTDKAVRGLQRLKKIPAFTEEIYRALWRHLSTPAPA